MTGGVGMTGGSTMTISVGPLSSAIALNEFEAWMQRATVGSDIVYATGPAMPRMSATCALVGEYGRAGLLHPFKRTCAGGFQYIARRIRRTVVDAAPVAAVAAAPGAVDDVEARLLRLLKRTANFALPCPTNAEIAVALDLKDEAAASYRMRKLVAAGLISILDHGPNRRRIVTIAGTSFKTREGQL